MTETPGDRLKKARKALGLKQHELAAKVGWVGAARISNYENNLRKISHIDAKILAKGINRDPEWLLFGTANEFSTEKTGKISIPKNHVPLLSWVQAGQFSGNTKDIVIDENTQFVPLINRGSARSFALRVEGDSMISPYTNKKSFYPNEVIIIDPERTPTNRDYVIAFKEGSHEATFKQYIVDSGMHFLKPLNPQYPTINIDDSVKICGVVIARLDYLV